MITCAITGSNGVLGRRIKKILPFKFYEFKKDIRDKKEVRKWILKKNFDIIIHLAALVPIKNVNKDYQKAYDINVKGSQYLVDSILKKKYKPKWFFYASTSHVYKLDKRFRKKSEKEKPIPHNKYGKTKLLAEKLIKKKLQNQTIKLCIGRIFSFTDKLQKQPFVVPSIIDKIKISKKEVRFRNLNNYRDFLSTKDIVNAIDTLRKKNKSGIFNIGSGNHFNLKDIALLFSKNYKKKLIFVDSKKPTYLISNNKKILKTKWKPSKLIKKIKYFY